MYNIDNRNFLRTNEVYLNGAKKVNLLNSLHTKQRTLLL